MTKRKQDWGWETGFCPWWGSRADLMGLYALSFPKKVDYSFDLFLGGGCALPWLSNRTAGTMYCSDLAIENTFLLDYLKENRGNLDPMEKELSLLVGEFMSLDLEGQKALAGKYFSGYSQPVFRSQYSPAFLAALPIFLGRITYGGKLGSRWFPGLKKRLRGNQPIPHLDLQAVYERAMEAIHEFAENVDLSRVEVHQEDYREILDRIALPQAKKGDKVLLWADPPFPMQSRGTKDKRAADPEASMPRAQYKYDFDLTSHSLFLLELVPFTRCPGASIFVPSYSNQYYDKVLLACGWKKRMLASAPKFIKWETYYFPEDPKDITKGKSEHTVSHRELSLEMALEHLESQYSDEAYQSLVYRQLKEIPTLKREDAKSTLRPVTNLSSFWSRAKEVLYCWVG